MSEVVKINFIGFWNNFDYKTFLPYQLISNHYDVQISDNPDILFCSIFDGYSFCKYSCLRVFCTSECYYPDMNLHDYAISITKMDVDNRVIQIPYFMYISNILDLQERTRMTQEELSQKEKFCNFVYSHSANVRDDIFYLISSYKRVDSAGRHLNNMNGFTPGQRESITGIANDPKISFQSGYKFSIACENYRYPDYVTEKIIHAYMSKSIPIYYGDPNICKIFNPKSFINVSDYENRNDLIERIKEIDNNDTLYLDIINEPIFNNQDYLSSQIDNLDRFLCMIVERKDEIRRPVNYNTRHLNDLMLSMDDEKNSIVLRTYRLFKRKTQ